MLGDATIKRRTDGKLVCSMKANEGAKRGDLPFKGKSYRYNSSRLCAHYSASVKDSILTFISSQAFGRLGSMFCRG